MNDTLLKFGYPDSTIKRYTHWVVLLRPAQVTLGSLVLASTSEALAFGDLPDGAHAELRVVTTEIERALSQAIDYERINYLMLMMVDPHVHFHVIPRYEGGRSGGGLTRDDAAWPGPPNLGHAVTPEPGERDVLRDWLAGHFG